MKLAFPHYEGDSILRPFIAPTITAPAKLVKPIEVVQRNMPKADPEPASINRFEIEMQARALRRELLREWINGIFGR
jgi:hypothetical protein